jgi:rhamnosyltransferase
MQIEKLSHYPSMSILIPVKNGMRWLPAVLKEIKSQTVKPSEMIAVDSGSTDGSSDFLKANGFIVYKIYPHEFGHGKTRNLLANMASGEFVVFLSQDAVPADEIWLHNLINFMKNRPDIAGAYSRQIAREDCEPFEKWFNQKTFPAGKKKMFAHNDINPQSSFSVVFSNASSCIQTKVLREFPFRSVARCEDRVWANEVLRNGYKIAYVSDSCVTHSHNFSIYDRVKVGRDDGIAHRQIDGAKYRGLGFLFKFKYIYNTYQEQCEMLEELGYKNSQKNLLALNGLGRSIAYDLGFTLGRRSPR